MASPSAGRARPRAPKVSKRVVFYVPDTFDPQIHLPEELRHLADYARYLLHRINVGRVHLRQGNCLVYLKHDYLARFMPRGRLTAIRDALEEAGVIRVRKFCVPGEMCYGYQLLHPHNQGFSHYHPTAKPLVARIKAQRVKEFRAVRLPLHRDLRRYIKALRIDEQAALHAVQGTHFQRSAQVSMVRAIAEGDFFTVADRFGRFHTNLTNLKASLRPFLRYRESKLVNLDIANSQPMIFCLLLAKLLSNQDQLDNLIDYEFPETNQPYHVELDEDVMASLPHISPRDFQEEQEEGDGRGEVLPILHAKEQKCESKAGSDNELRRPNNRQAIPQDALEFIELCERGILYDDLMRRLGIPARRRDGFKRLIFTQVFFGRNEHSGIVRELFARDFPTVYRAIDDLKRKDHRQLAYLLQAHESKLMIDIICRRILDELPGTFVATIHDSILTTPDKAEEVRAIMVEAFQGVGLNPTIRTECY